MLAICLIITRYSAHRLGLFCRRRGAKEPLNNFIVFLAELQKAAPLPATCGWIISVWWSLVAWWSSDKICLYLLCAGKYESFEENAEMMKNVCGSKSWNHDVVGSAIRRVEEHKMIFPSSATAPAARNQAGTITGQVRDKCGTSPQDLLIVLWNVSPPHTRKVVSDHRIATFTMK